MAPQRFSRRKRERFMKNDYLWDGLGEPDPELQRIEKSLSRFGYTGKPPEFPAADFLQSKSRFAFFPSGWTPRFGAAIWAPPGEFVVDTPSATAIDLGCAYTLHVNDDGSGTLRTTLGWVGFHKDGHDSFIPAGAMCATRPVQGPGTPYFEDASEKLRSALHAFDFESLSAADREQALHTVLAQARRRDAFTLWHLLARVNVDERAQVYDRLASLVTPPANVTREGTLALDRQMM